LRSPDQVGELDVVEQCLGHSPAERDPGTQPVKINSGC
jgi:hypothetical protein